METTLPEFSEHLGKGSCILFYINHMDVLRYLTCCRYGDAALNMSFGAPFLFTIQSVVLVATCYSRIKRHPHLDLKRNNYRVNFSGSLLCYLIALGSGKALQFMQQLSGDSALSEQRIVCGSLQYGTPHTW